jgi:hypothetical protein
MKVAAAFARDNFDRTRLAAAVPSATDWPKLARQRAAITGQPDGAHGSATRTKPTFLFDTRIL